MTGEKMARPEFEREVLDGLTELRTHMKTLVGVDGSGGKIATIETRVNALESKQDQDTGRRQGFGWVKTAAASGLGFSVGAAIQKIIHW